MTNSNTTLGDKEIISDSLASQKLIGTTYDTYAFECVNDALRAEFINILKEEHDIQADLFSEMQKRGWYQVTSADQNMVTQTKNKYQGMI